MIAFERRERLTDNDLTGIVIADVKHNSRLPLDSEEFDVQLQSALDGAIGTIENMWLGTTIAVNKYKLTYPCKDGIYLVQGDVDPDSVVVKVDGDVITDFNTSTNDALGRRDVWVWLDNRDVNTELTIEADIGFAEGSRNFKLLKSSVLMFASHIFNDPSAYSPTGVNMNPAFVRMIGHLRPQMIL